MPANLALHRADVRMPDGSITEGVTITCRQGHARAMRERDIVASLPVDSIEEVQRGRFWRLTGPDGEWMVKRTGGCRPCAASSRWPT